MSNKTYDSYEWSDSAIFGSSTGAMTVEQVSIRKLFVENYLLDRNAYSAALRCGFAHSKAQEYAHTLLNEQYVQNLIVRESLLKDKMSDREDRLLKQNQILDGLIREAFYYGVGSSASARVAALSKLAAIYNVDGIEEEDKPKGGIMFVPAQPSIEDWESDAVKQQTALADEALKDV